MQLILDLFDDTRQLNIVFFILSVVGIVLSIYFYYKSKREKQPVFSKKTFSLVQSDLTSLKNLEIKCNGSKVDNLSLTKIAFWNSGKEPIRKEDLVASDPLMIFAPENVVIFDEEISFQNPVNRFVVEKLNDHSISISFDFINYRDGIVIYLYHSGKKSSDFSLKGTLIGARKITTGVKKNVLLNRVDFLFKPIRYLVYDKGGIIRVIGFFLGALIAAVMIPLVTILMPIDFIYDRINRSYYCKEFYLYDE